jgi:metallo-beta-lactamase class B
MRLRLTAIICFIACTSIGVTAQVTRVQRHITNEDWIRPISPIRIVGNLYYVGTHNLASYLITTSDGHILVNTGVASSVPMIRANIESLGFSFDDIRLLLATHGHWDHVSGMAEIKRLTGARMLMHEGDVAMLEDGGNTDFRFPEGRGQLYEPVTVDRRLQHGDKVELGTTELTAHHHPGHTKGSTSFTFTTEDTGRTYRVLIVNMGGINQGVELLDTPGNPNIIEEYAETFERQKQLIGNFDIWVASHSNQFALHDKYEPSDTYDPNRFVDPEGYAQSVQQLEQIYLGQLEREQESR